MMPLSVPRETEDRFVHLKSLVEAENRRQNLVSSSTLEEFDERHLRDSLQLLPFCPDGVLVDVGSGGGFPGLVLALCRSGRTHLVEPRAKRADFLTRAAAQLGLQDRVIVHASKIERVRIGGVSTITARAVAALERLFTMAHHLAEDGTQWVLPKGRSATSELEQARRTWQGEFRLVPSETDAGASIVIAKHVQRRQAR